MWPVGNDKCTCCKFCCRRRSRGDGGLQCFVFLGLTRCYSTITWSDVLGDLHQEARSVTSRPQILRQAVVATSTHWPSP